ncbi:hypothetical protein JCM10449v2_000967 [Rhodotorula kratochvilovae]
MATTPSTSRAPAVPSLDTSDFLETRSVQLEWKVTNLRTLFDQTKGEAKSKCIKSALFDQSRWQIFLYPNSGHDQYVSVYLSCEPTVAEKERALAEQPALAAAESAQGAQGGKEKERIPWRRDGRFHFTFEVRSVDRRVTFKQLESEKPHMFWYRERNWGYNAFWRRSEAFYNNPGVRSADAFVIICTIVSSPTLPSTPPLPHLLVPKTLIHAYASLFDDPDYSDVVFRIRPEGRSATGRTREKRLYAAKKVLAGRSEYFDMMFSSAFSEAKLTRPSTSRRDSRPTPTTTSGAHPLRSATGGGVSGEEDSDDEEENDEDSGWDEDDDSGVDESDEEGDDGEYGDDVLYAAPGPAATHSLAQPPVPPRPASPQAVPFPALQAAPESPEAVRSAADAQRRSRTSSVDLSDEERPSSGAGAGAGEQDQAEDDDEDTEEDGGGAGRPVTPRGSRFVDAPSAPASPVRAEGAQARAQQKEVRRREKARRGARAGDDRPRFEVVVTDAAYSTFRALLHFLYTDSISFSPLASTYYVAKDLAAAQGQPFPHASRRAYLAAQAPGAPAGPEGPAGAGAAVKSAAVGPASAKAIYRLADKMGLAELKERAYEHVVSSLTAQNIVYEVFGSFSSRFDEIRRVEVAFLLDKWNEVRAGPQMRKVFEYLRSPSRFPGFEDVWLEIVQNLEVRVPPPAALTSSAGTSGAAQAGGAGGRSAAGEEEEPGR